MKQCTWLVCVVAAFLLVACGAAAVEDGRDARQLAGVRGKQKVQIYKNPTASAFSSDWTPIRVRLGKDFNSSTVTLCKLNWQRRAETPATIPMFQDLIRVSQCNRVANRKMVSLGGMAGVIEPWLAAHGAGKWNADDPEFGQHAKNFPNLHPSGLIFHEMRVGSTLLSNMLQAASGNLAYSESPPPMDIMRHSTADRATKVRALRIVIAAMSRVAGFERFYFKFQMVPFPEMYNMLWEAFPNTPWVYLFRRPEDVMVSMFRMQMDRKLPTDIDAPCTRTQRRRPEPHVVTLLTAEHADVKRASRKEFCAAYLATLNWAGLEAGKQAEQNKLAAPEGWFLHYNSLKPMARAVITQLFKTELDDAQWAQVNATGSLYSKSRNRLGKPKQVPEFGTDNKRKSEVLTDEVIWFTSKYLYGQYGELLTHAGSTPGLPKEQVEYLKAEAEWLQAGGSKAKMKDSAKWEALDAARKSGGQVTMPKEEQKAAADQEAEGWGPGEKREDPALPLQGKKSEEPGTPSQGKKSEEPGTPSQGKKSEEPGTPSQGKKSEEP